MRGLRELGLTLPLQRGRVHFDLGLLGFLTHATSSDTVEQQRRYAGKPAFNSSARW
jgi:hypothetical protein